MEFCGEAGKGDCAIARIFDPRHYSAWRDVLPRIYSIYGRIYTHPHRSDPPEMSNMFLLEMATDGIGVDFLEACHHLRAFVGHEKSPLAIAPNALHPKDTY